MRSAFSQWQEPPAKPVLDENVHVWCVHLEYYFDRLQALLEVLSGDELERANRFYFQRDRKRFIVARAVLRIILGQYLERPAAQLRFRYNDYGKPYLANSDGELSFNLSHSDNLAVYGFVPRGEIGVDVERVKPDFATHEIARRFFSLSEVRDLTRLPAQKQAEAFFACWTRKEAYIKAKGQGLSIPLHRFRVSLNPEKPALLESWPYPEDVQRLEMHSFHIEDYLGAVVVEKNNYGVRYFKLS